ncbi:MAG: cob(I)yrinic acid a,c-diamide adenosyltransferase, partial [Lachnospiraceae bacterium]|nr:cob(I)yrinic acid a,c-diamide adenosyltransferase [Lachnospiraceae bacterium]
MIQLYTGNGKGKTTAAVGQALRAAGDGYRVIFSQFMKGNASGELVSLENIPNVDILRSSKSFGFYSTLGDEEKRSLRIVHDEILGKLITYAESGSVFMIVMDEITYPVKWGLIDTDSLKRLLELAGGREDNTPELILTGRDAADFIVDAADYIT